MLKSIADAPHQLLVLIVLFGTGDIAFIFIAEGRVASSFWCLGCDLHPDQYKVEGHNSGNEWTRERLENYAERWKNGEFNRNEAAALSVRKKEYWPAIATENWGDARLHKMLGHGNDVVGPTGYLMKTIESKIVRLSDRERADILERASVELLIQQATADLKEWDKANRSSRAKNNRDLEKKKGTYDTTPEPTLAADILELEKNIKAADAERKTKAEEVKRLEKLKSTVVARLNRYAKKRKVEEGGIHDLIEKVLIKYEIKRGAYHGGAFNGPHLRRYMEKAKEIFNEVRVILKNNNREEDMDANDIDKLCNDCIDLLTTIDAINTNLMQWYLQWDDDAKKAVEELKVLVRHASAAVRRVGMSVTPKWTLQEDHCVSNHVRLIKLGYGGAVWLDESYVEVEHKKAKVLDRRVQGVLSFQDKQHAQLKIEQRSNNPEIDAEREHNTRVPKKRKSTKGDALRQAKKERREEKVATAKSVVAGEEEQVLDVNINEEET